MNRRDHRGQTISRMLYNNTYECIKSRDELCYASANRLVGTLLAKCWLKYTNHDVIGTGSRGFHIKITKYLFGYLKT